jgi:hypothetical protein
VATFTLNPSASRQIIDTRNAPYDTMQPGDEIVLSAGTYAGVVFKLVWGTEQAPITVRNNGAVILDTRGLGYQAIVFEFCRHIRLLGNGGSDTTRQMRLRSGSHGVMCRARSDHFEIAYLHITEAQNQAGISLDPLGYTSSSWPYGAFASFPVFPSYVCAGWDIHHCLIENPDGTLGTENTKITEGMYLGKNKTSWSDPNDPIPDMNELDIHHNIIRNMRWESIQTITTPTNNSPAIVCDVHDNICIGDSLDLAAGVGQMGSIRFKQRASGRCFRNIVVGGQSHGILLTGNPVDSFTTEVFNNVVVDCNIGHTGSGSIESQNRRRVLIAHNTIVSPGPAGVIGVRLANNCVDHQLRNNLIVDADTPYSLGTGSGHVVTPSQAATAFADGSTLDFVQTIDPFAANYYALGADSAAADASTDDTGLATDFNGAARTSPYSLGAYEAAAVSGEEPEEVVLPVAFDGQTAENIPDSQGGTVNRFTTNNNSGNRRRALIQFDLSSLAGATVVSAVLRLFNEDVGSADRTLSVYRIKAANSGWVAGATWNFADGSSQRWAGDTGGNGGGDAGCSVAGVDFEETAIGTFTVTVAGGADQQYDVALDAAQLQAMVDGANDGFVIVRDDTANNSVQIWSDEATDPAHAPKLLVTYTPAAEEPTAPAAPSDLAATALSPYQIDLTWTDNADNESGFVVERSANGSTGWSEIATRGADITAHSDGNLQPETQYFYRVKATNDAGDSAYTSTANATTQAELTPDPDVPDAPTDFAAIADGTTQIDLAWTDNADNESGFVVERGPSAEQFDYVIEVSANVEAHSDTGLTPATTYHYRMRAVNATGESANTPVVSATTDPAPTAPDAPSGLQAVAVSSRRIDLTWVDNSDDESGFVVEMRETGESEWQTVATRGAGVTQHSVIDLEPETEYEFRVKAFNGVGDSAYTDAASATTLEAVAAHVIRRGGLRLGIGVF